VNLITTAVPPAELSLPPEPMTRISVFMNVFDCHVNRSPVTGRIEQILYTPGLFLNAELDKASDDNERNGLVIETSGATDQVLKLLPPLTIQESRLREGLDILERSVATGLGLEQAEAKKVAFVHFGGAR